MNKTIDDTAEYCRQRKVFGKPVLDNQAVHFRLAELATEVELVRALLYKTVELYVQGNDVTKLASMCKLKCGRLARIVSDNCLQYWGGMGYTKEVLISRSYRDSRLMSIGGGTDEIIDKEINPYVSEWESAAQWPAHKIMKKLGDAGFLGVNKPVEYGGLGLDYTYCMAVNETYGKINCGGVPMGIGVQTDVATPSLARFGSDKLKREFLAPAISGDVVACLGVSEIGAGSDVSGIQTNAKKSGDDLIINGHKTWITNSCQADWMCLLANTGEGNSHKNKSLIIVPMKTPGVHIAKKIEKLGMHSSDTGQIYFEDVRVPKSHIIGEEGAGFLYQMLQFQEERLCGAAMTLYPLERMIKETVEYCGQRKVFGRPVLDNQYVYFRLAELETEIVAYRALVYMTAKLYVEGSDMTKWVSMCKLKGGRLLREVADSCLQFYGGMGYTSEVNISRSYRDSRLWSIGGGADEIMLIIISKYMNMLPSNKKTTEKSA